jgi:hypothetical protein
VEIAQCFPCGSRYAPKVDRVTRSNRVTRIKPLDRTCASMRGPRDVQHRAFRSSFRYPQRVALV